MKSAGEAESRPASNRGKKNSPPIELIGPGLGGHSQENVSVLQLLYHGNLSPLLFN